MQGKCHLLLYVSCHFNIGMDVATFSPKFFQISESLSLSWCQLFESQQRNKEPVL